MDCVIVGSGPTGMSLAYFLEKTKGYKTLVIEKDSVLGGSWNSKLTGEGYFTENAPRVQFESSSFINFLKYADSFEDKDVEPIYGGRVGGVKKVVYFALKSFDLKDYVLFGSLFIRSNIYLLSDTINVEELLEYYSFSPKGKKAIRTICITLNDIPEKTNANDFLQSIILSFGSQFIQFRDSNKWHEEIEKKCPGTTFMKSTKLLKIIPDNKKFKLLIQNNSGNTQTIETTKCILAIDGTSLPKILDNSDPVIQNNWLQYDVMKKWCNSTTYSAFSFQLHFKTPVKYIEEWCWSCMGDWSIIILPVSNWLDPKFFPNDIKTIWSCTVVDLQTRSKEIGKSCNECNKSEATDECLRQVSELYRKEFPTPFKITYASDLRKEGNKWKSANTGFTRGDYDFLPSKGKLNNLFYVGPHNPRGAEVTHAGVAIDSSVEYMRNYESEFIVLSMTNLLIKILVLLMIVYAIYFILNWR